MGLSFVGRVLSTTRGLFQNAQAVETKSDLGGGSTVIAPHYGPPGDVGVPLPGDYSANMRVAQSNRFATVGFLDPTERPVPDVAEWGPGARWLYSRNAEGEVTAEIQLFPDGTVRVRNVGGAQLTIAADGSVTLAAAAAVSVTSGDGTDINLNGVTIDNNAQLTAAKVTAPSVVADGVEVAGHTHSQGNDTGGDTEQDTDPMK